VTTSQSIPNNLSHKKVLLTWLPLVASWLLMSIELPTINAFVARLPNAEVTWRPMAALSSPCAHHRSPGDHAAGGRHRPQPETGARTSGSKRSPDDGRFLGMRPPAGGCDPLYDFIVNMILQVPEAVVEPGRSGLLFSRPGRLLSLTAASSRGP
jgi:hypothetical protein